MHFFGFFGLLATGAGTLIDSFLVFKKLVLHQEIMLQNGPLLFAATVLILTGIQLLCLGLASELLSRTYYESQGKPIYVAREIRNHEAESALSTMAETGRVRRVIPADKMSDSVARLTHLPFVRMSESRNSEANDVRET